MQKNTYISHKLLNVHIANVRHFFKNKYIILFYIMMYYPLQYDLIKLLLIHLC